MEKNRKEKGGLFSGLASLFSSGKGEEHEVGETVTLGTYAGEKIEWQILEKKAGGSYVLLAKEAVEVKPYHTGADGAAWENCSLRAWLNGDFYNGAFSDSAKKKIVKTTVPNPGNAVSGTAGGAATEDRVYLLSLEETAEYFGVDAYDLGSAEGLICMPSKFAAGHGANMLLQESIDKFRDGFGYELKAGACSWWLRSPGETPSRAAYVGPSGLVSAKGISADIGSYCVRPVVCAKL